MPVTVKLDDILEGMEAQGEEISSYLNKRTGKVVTIMDEEFMYAEEDEHLDSLSDWQKDMVLVAKEIMETDDYIKLPDQFEINEYQIMENFCFSLPDDKLREMMYNSIKGKGAFGRFKENIHRFGIADNWYAYRERARRKIAIGWCEYNGISYT